MGISRRFHRRAWVSSPALVAALLGIGCATRQKVSLECVPKDVVIYVDGELLDGVPEELALDPASAHKVFLKSEAYEPQMAVFSTEEVEGKARLAPSDLCSQVMFEPVEREVVMEPDFWEAP
jgi:hypothetical protein